MTRAAVVVVLCIVLAGGIALGCLFMAYCGPRPKTPASIVETVKKLEDAGATVLEPVKTIEPGKGLPKGTKVVARIEAESGDTTPAAGVELSGKKAWFVEPQNLGCAVKVDVAELEGVWAVTVNGAGFLDVGKGERIQGPHRALDVVRLAQVAPEAAADAVAKQDGLPWLLAGTASITTEARALATLTYFPSRRRVGVTGSYATGGTDREAGVGVAFRLGPK